MSNWKNPKIIVGNVAKGDFYFPRLDIEAQIWEELDKGSHILLAAPRRVGKTSVMLSMLENSPADIRCIFKNIQGVQSEESFTNSFLNPCWNV
jgi:predicted AAA+ superfamily ATPase